MEKELAYEDRTHDYRTPEDRLHEWQARSAAGHIAARSPAQEEALSPEQEKARALAQEQAEWMAHPHTQLAQIITDLQAPHVDIHDRIGAIHRGALALARFLHRDSGEAPPKPGEKKE